MKVKESKLSQKMVQSLEMPKDIVLGIANISIWGNREMTVDNHRGISRMNSKSILIDTKDVKIEINGKNLQVENYSNDYIHIVGQMDQICFYT